MKFYDTDGKEKDAIKILKDHGLNYIRLRIFNDPARDSGYSPIQDFAICSIPCKWQKELKQLV
ncbi:MAG: glycosyl hydrolase 53 family protein [Chitinophagaceae bacterium]|nr:glycosyl hydrolase 53 family protein [Chitinophagaceae bacterium]